MRQSSQQSRQQLPAGALPRRELFARSLDTHFGLTI
jgi:hypothetical protein